ncbi:hypothetical protein [Aeromonas sobria]|uniref:hypothetical protein n=1 Tax=Aeromonas sobria TaxID=646 RepID=UPI003F40EF36
MSKNTDVPALSGAAVAGSVSIFMGSGSYGVVSGITGLTLIFFLLTYSWSSADSTLRKIVFSMVFSLVSLPLIAFLVEGYMYFIDGCHYILNSHCLDGFGREDQTKVTDYTVLLSWLSIFGLVFILICVRNPTVKEVN